MTEKIAFSQWEETEDQNKWKNENTDSDMHHRHYTEEEQQTNEDKLQKEMER